MSEAAFPRSLPLHNEKPIQFDRAEKITIWFCILILVCPHLYYSNDILDSIMSFLKGKKIVNLHFSDLMV